MTQPKTIDALGQTWTFAPADRATRQRYCAWVKALARKSLAEEKASGLDPDLYRDGLAALQDRIDSGDYSWGDDRAPGQCGSAIQAVLASTHGQVQLLRELLRPAHGDLDIEKVLGIVTDNPQAVRIALLAAFGLPDLPQEPTA